MTEEMKFTQLQIEDKIVAFEYSVLKLVEWQMAVEKLSIDDFNKNNNFTTKKLALLPYFFLVANGTKKLMSLVFGKYLAKDDGNIEDDIQKELENLKNGTNSSFSFIQLREGKIFLNSSFFEFNTTILTIKNETLEKKLNITVSIRRIIDSAKLDDNNEYDKKSKSFKSIYELLNHSIQQYCYNNWILYKFDDSQLSKFCKRSTSWFIYNSIGTLKNSIIPNEYLLDESSYFQENADTRIGTI